MGRKPSDRGKGRAGPVPHRGPRTVAIARRLELLPDSPGVYLFKDAAGRVLYIGKAKRLPDRVRSYFQPGAIHGPRIANLVDQVRDLEYVATGSETEALVLEANLVKSYAPRYNVMLKDDKRFPFLKVTLDDPYPRLEVTRRVVADGSRYFGPFPRVKDLRQLVRSMRRVFPLRSCSDQRLRRGGRPCLFYAIDLCLAPCAERDVGERYRRAVDALVRFLDGRDRELLHEWRREMQRLASELRFEESAALRDRIARLEALTEQQRFADPARPDLDAIGLAMRGDRAAAAIFSHRGGAVVGTWRVLARRTRDAEAPVVLQSMLLQHYQTRRQIAARILCDPLPSEPDLLTRWLGERAGRRVRIHAPRRGDAAALVRAARQNAQLFLEEEEALAEARRERLAPALYALQEALQLTRPPRRIEGYDISNLQGTNAVGSRVVFRDGSPQRGAYRRYRIRTVEGADDFAMLAEVLRRRLRRMQAEQEAPPDLVLVDGGRGQVERVARVMAEAGAEAIPLAGLAKREEEVFLRGRREPLRLARSSAALQLLQRVRDEAHRFAVGYHRRLRRGVLEQTPLTRIPGVGARRAAQLIGAFGSLGGLRRASVDAIAALPGIGHDLAKRIAAALQGEAPDA